MLSPTWYNTLAKIERWVTTTVDRVESGVWKTLHEASACTTAGIYNKADPTILGVIAPTEQIVTWPLWAITDVYGNEVWPEERDKVTLTHTRAGRTIVKGPFYIHTIADQTMVPAHSSIPPHIIAHLSLKPTKKA